MASPSAEPYTPTHPIRIVSAASLFDGHDAAINVMRRILQASGAEVIHLGHNRSVAEIVNCAIQEDAQGIAMTSYQGGHLEFFKYMHDLLKERGADIRIMGGGGGTILPAEAEELEAYGIAKIYSPDDGRELGLQGMVNDLLQRCDFATVVPPLDERVPLLPEKDPRDIAQCISLAENHPEAMEAIRPALGAILSESTAPVLGVTGTGGAGKSTLVDEIIRRLLADRDDVTIAVLSVDPSKRKTGGALLGDRIRMNSIHNSRVYMRSLATRQSNAALSRHVADAIDICKAAGYSLVIVETSGIGQSDSEIADHADTSLYVMTPDYGAATQLEKIDMLDFADVIAVNKSDKQGAEDALRDVQRQYQRNHKRFDDEAADMPVYGAIASQFNDEGTTTVYRAVMEALANKTGADLSAPSEGGPASTVSPAVIPPERTRYLAEIVESNEKRKDFIDEQTAIASRLYQLKGALEVLRQEDDPDPSANLFDVAPRDNDPVAAAEIVEAFVGFTKRLDPACREKMEGWPALKASYEADTLSFEVRGKTHEHSLTSETLSGLMVPKICLPRYEDWGDILRWLLTEAPPGQYPFTSGVFPIKRMGEDPARMFAGEGGPERTNKRFHYLSKGLEAKRLSTAFDSVTLYGEDPDSRPDIYGKVGNSGVSVANLDDAKKLYSGFDLSDPKTSVSMTINGPAPMVLGFFLNAAIDQSCEKYIHEQGMEKEIEKKIDQIYEAKGIPRPAYRGDLPAGNDGLGLFLLGVTGDQVLPEETYEQIKADTLTRVRGTVQADILKEDQAQNTCIFSTEFALRLMGDIQQYFVDQNVRNFYSVSISGYHIAEAGANPITQLAFTLANGFTYVEYYLSRGMGVDTFARNLSFFFSNGMDAEYSVLGRVARRIWARAVKNLYGGNSRSQKLKYHIQTSGRSLHAQEISFNDIRTTLQALYAIYDNCNSLHTNAYDEAITTPTEESVRRALAIQLVINRELGLARNENPLQGSFVIEELTDLVEEAVMAEFLSLNDRGGVLGAMERMYQRSRIQEESLHYESLKHSGKLPVVGVNTFLDSKGSPTLLPREVIRSSKEEKDFAISCRDAFHARNKEEAPASLERLAEASVTGQNTFEALMEACKVATLSQLSRALYDVGGQYRRSM
ncbi:MAG: methylmalonyl-CoA mutase family protein [Planctomycetota bacterium]|nr:methylmalonyl-CoA mutase family protein [Planctomycetota bacterium]